jgi:hypothetical protein
MSRLLPSQRIALATVLLLAACPGGSADSDDSGDSGSNTVSGIPTVPTSMSSTGGDDDGSTTGDSTPTTGATAGESDSTTGEFVCLADDIQADVRIPRVMLVLDKSASMIASPGGFWDADADDADDDGFVDGDPNMTPATPKITRWDSLYNVVDFIVTGFEPRMDFGAVLFPSTKATKSYDAGACKVNVDPEVPVGTDQGATILATIPGANDMTLLGGTPAASGIMAAVGALPRDEALSIEEDLRYIVLVTDGAANCAIDAKDNHDRFEEYDEHLPENVTAALVAGIPTFVVGIDIKDVESPVINDGNPDATNTFVRLNELAEFGGQARPGAEKFYNTNNQVELQAALEAISEAITSCTFELNVQLDDYTKVKKLEVSTDKDPVTEPNTAPLKYDENQITDCATESGWHFTDDTRKFIELCGDACSAYKSTGIVDIEFECTPP